MNLENRIEALEKTVEALEPLEAVEIHMFREDCSKNGPGESELFMIIHAGTPGGQPGCTFNRGEGESLEDFLDRASQFN